MKKKLLTKIIFLLTLFYVVSAASAHIPIPRGWYADGSVGLTNTNTSNNDDDDDDDNNHSSTALGYNINAGYKFLPFFGLEAGYTSYGTSSSSFTGNHAIDIALKGIIPFPEIGVEIYAKLGGAEVYPQNEGNSSNLYYGFGADYWLFSNMSVLMQWMQAKNSGGGGPLNLFSIGVGFLI